MAPKKKIIECCCCRDSKINLRQNYNEKNSSNSNHPDTGMLNRLRPRTNRVKKTSETMCKVCKRQKNNNRNNKTRRCVKKSFSQYKTNHRYRRNNNTKNSRLRNQLSRKSTGYVKPRTVFLRSILQASKIIPEVKKNSYDKNETKSKSFVQIIKNYFFSTLLEGTKWAKNYVYQSFKAEDKSKNSSRIPRIILNNSESLCSSDATESVEQLDRKDSSKIVRYKSRENLLQRGDGIKNSTTCNKNLFLNERRFNDYGDENDDDDADDNLARNKRDQTRSKSRRKRKKIVRRKKRVAFNVMRYNKVGIRTIQYESEKKNSISEDNILVVNLKKSNTDFNSKENNGEFYGSNNNEEENNFGDKNVDEYPVSINLTQDKIIVQNIENN